MKRTALALLATLAAALGLTVAAGPASAAGVVYGMDVSHYQGSINWGAQYSAGARFVYIKATEGTTYTDPNFGSNYTGSYDAGFIRGAYHFARPGSSSGAAQANYFLAHGGRWSGDGKTLPGALDMEYNPSGATCYGLSASAMGSWIRDFSNTYHAATGVYPVIYTSTSWWSQCVSGDFSGTNPLWIARYSSSVGALPAGWGYYTFWQNADSGTYPGDQDRFNGDLSQLQALARG
ncbi:Lyzozyme M1 (1,4-beta-N-acetylmuramidase), GH25 family [Jatrophihabitans endophyticus]|uniref:Lysozyme n=1 Tax=Jatrophihabitans endophyticus TaxID=1206085 RepID=A0A1M5LHX8_9ACTN|nr:lysozyme [Jatrophihabitans endophyticus]SHG63973.1 Lyzozyme M1 (1,4-beta-N-acetylmuramidase), GH25 family [Jatrophihabitans endophyticus]